MPKISQVVKSLRENFGDENLFFTFVPYDHKGRQQEPSTFASDNIQYLDNWLLMKETQFISKKLKDIPFVVRRFLRGENNKIENGKGMKIPKKELFHFLAGKNGVIGFNIDDTYSAQNTDCETGEPLKPENGLIYCDSQVLLKEMFSPTNLNVDKILDKINNYGIQNLAKYELDFLKSQKKSDTIKS